MNKSSFSERPINLNSMRSADERIVIFPKNIPGSVRETSQLGRCPHLAF